MDHTQSATEPQQAGSSTADTVLACATLAAVPLVLSACGGGGGGGGGDGDGDEPAPLGPAITFTGLTIAVTTSTAAAVHIDAVAADAEGAAAFRLDGGSGTVSRPRDPGHRQAESLYEFAISAEGGMGSATGTCVVRINPAPEDILSESDARVLSLRHLFNRMSFGVGEEELGRWLNVPYAEAVQRIVDAADPSQTTQRPPSAATFHVLTWTEYDRLSPAEQQAYGDSKGDAISGIYAWWWREIIRTRQPLLEKMALFWHNLLVVAASDVFEPRAMWGYLDLLRSNALGSYRDLILAIARDPAMVMFLDSNSNVKGRPNENFARELLELFTLGEGHVYGEADVVEVAKCFTGWGITDRQVFVLRQDRHEPGAKTVLGSTISFADDDPEQVRKDGEAVIERVLQESRVAVFICEKLWDEFVGGARDDGMIAGWADTFRGSGDYDIRRVLKDIFTSSAFTAAGNRGNMIRSPVEYAAAIFRATGLQPGRYIDYYWRASQEDQALLNPPNVRGWVGGLQWISAKTLLERRTHMAWTGWEFYNHGSQKVPERLDGVLELLWFATPVAQRAYVDDAVLITWDPRGERIRRLLTDPALNCK
ncbi:MAG: DUF1800 domain-containing protein [Planctomycetes bacterium]|nr:DUF1800 domain-containing protein [Planctomycetota bacterium]